MRQGGISGAAIAPFTLPTPIEIPIPPVLVWCYIWCNVGATQPKGHRSSMCINHPSLLQFFRAPSAGRRLLALLLPVLALLLACEKPVPAHISVGLSDTIIVNSRQPVALPVQVFDSRDAIIPHPGVRWLWVHEDSTTRRAVLSDSGIVQCRHRADIAVQVHSGPIGKQITLLCRPIAIVRSLPLEPLRLGGPPGSYEFGALAPDTTPVDEVAAIVTIADTNIAVLHDNLVHPRSVGETWLHVQVGDCNVSLLVSVEDPVDDPRHLAFLHPFETRFTLASGEMRSWHPPSGLVYVHLLSAPAGSSFTTLAIRHADCTNLRESHRAWSCVMSDSSVVAAQNTRSVPAEIWLRLEVHDAPTGSLQKPKRAPRRDAPSTCTHLQVGARSTSDARPSTTVAVDNVG